MDGAVEKEKNGMLIGVLVFLCVAIVGLVVGIVVASVSGGSGGKNSNEVGEEAADTVESNAVTVNESILDKLRSDPDYNFASAKTDFAREMALGDNERRIDIARYYAEYVYSVNGNAEEAVEILTSVENLANSEKLKINYYSALRDFYNKIGDKEQLSYYNQLIVELVPDSVVTNLEGQ